MNVPEDEQMFETIEHFRQRRRLPSVDQDHLASVIDEISLTGREPVKYVAGLFARHEIVFVGHNFPSRKTGTVSYTHLTLPTKA